MTDSIYAWSQTPASNASADASINWAEFQNPDTVNDSARQMMARIAAYISDTAPKRTSTGSGNAYAVTSDAAGAALVNGMVICFIADRANTGSATLNVDGLGAKSFRPISGTDFNAGDILAGQPVIAFYNSATTEWLALNTGYAVSSTAAGLGIQSIIASLPKIGDMVLSMSATPAAGRIRLTESTQSILKSAYPELNTWLSNQSYPFGSTATHFTLPAAAGYVLRFAATSSSIDTSGARAAGSTQSDQNKAHTHSVSGTTDTVADHTHFLAANTNSSTGITANDQLSKQWTVLSDSGYDLTGTSTAATLGKSGAAGGHTHTISGAAASSGSDEVRVKNVAYHVDVVASTADAAAEIAVFGFPFQFDIGTSAADPGAGRLRGNNATLASITAIYINNSDRWGQSLATLFSSLDVGTRLVFSKIGAQGNRLVFEIASAPSAGSGYYAVGVTTVTATGSFSNSDACTLEIGANPGPVGLTWEGAWLTATAYLANDAVQNGGSSYICISGHTSGASTEPGTGASWETVWDLMASSGLATVDDAIFVDGSGNVGIGNESPTALLTVGSGPRFKLNSDGTLNWGEAAAHGLLTWTSGVASVLGMSGNALSLGANGVSGYIYINTSGNVGIGNTSPTALLTVGSGPRFKLNSDGTLNWGSASAHGEFTWDTGKAIIRGMSGNALSLGANGVNGYIYINTSGNVGIGTTSPSVTLSVDGPIGLKSYTVATVPSAATVAGQFIYVSNESGGAVPAFSDGTNWRRVTDRAVIS